MLDFPASHVSFRWRQWTTCSSRWKRNRKTRFLEPLGQSSALSSAVWGRRSDSSDVFLFWGNGLKIHWSVTFIPIFALCWRLFVVKEVSNSSKINLQQVKLLSTKPLVFTYQHSNTITTSCAWQGKAEGLLWRGVPKESAADRGENPSWYSELPILQGFKEDAKKIEVQSPTKNYFHFH